MKELIVVAGPTASGKSDFAVEVAKKLDGEIISCDSRQAYTALDIGTGKITEEEMAGIPHHMLSKYDLGEQISVARFARDAEPILQDILHRGKTPILVGGTGQYIDALIFDTKPPDVPPDEAFRKRLEHLSTEELARRLSMSDPARASAIDIHNRPRLIRALEIVEALGKVPPQEAPTLRYPTKIFLLAPSKETLKERIEARLEKRLKQGMVEEVQRIMAQGYTSEDMKRFGLEYEIIGRYLEGALDEENMKMGIVKESMRYAKRQMTWNKKYEKLPETEIIK